MNIAISYKTESEFNTLVRYCDENKIKKVLLLEQASLV